MKEVSPVQNFRANRELLQHLVQILKKASVLLGRTDTDTNPFRKLVLIHCANDHPASQKTLKHFFAIAYLDQDKVGNTRYVLELAFGKSGLKKLAALPRYLPGFGSMCLILKPGKSSCLRNRIHIERLPRLLEKPDEIRVSQSVPDSQAGQSLDFGKGSEHNDIGMVMNVFQRIGRIGQKLVVRFVNRNYNRGRGGCDKLIQLLLSHHCSSRIIRICDINDFCPPIDRTRHCWQIVR